MTSKSEVGKHLHEMKWMDAFYRLEFDDHQIFNKQIQAVTAIEVHPLIDERNRNLGLKRSAPKDQLSDQAGAIGRFEKTGTKRTMDIYRRSYHEP